MGKIPHLPIVWKDFNATVTGSVEKEATCDACGIDYVFTIHRSAQGQGKSLYYLDNAGTQSRAYTSAQKYLELLLETEIDPIPCPKCGHFRPEMVQEARRRHLACMSWQVPILVFIAWIGSTLLLTCLNFMLANPGPLSPWAYVLPVFAVGGCSVLAIPLVRVYLALKYDPNRESPEIRIMKGYVGGIEVGEYERMQAEKDTASRRRRHRS